MAAKRFKQAISGGEARLTKMGGKNNGGGGGKGGHGNPPVGLNKQTQNKYKAGNKNAEKVARAGKGGGKGGGKNGQDGEAANNEVDAAAVAANMARFGAGMQAQANLDRSDIARGALANQTTQSSLAFAPELQEPIAVDKQDGISLAELDGSEFPVHERGISIRKPELVAVFNFEPVFSGNRVHGTPGNSERLLTDAGKFVDAQVNARKIRISDIETLFSQLSEDPESPTGKITQNMIEILEEKIGEANQDFATIDSASKSVSMFLDALNLKNPSESIAKKFLEIRKARFERNPLLLPEKFIREMDFRTILKKNHGFSDEQINAFSSTKLFLYFLYDIRSLLMGPIENPNYPLPYRGLGKLADRRLNDIPEGRDVFLPRTRIGGHTNSKTLFAVPLIDATDGYGRGAFGEGICSLTLPDDTALAGQTSFLGQITQNGDISKVGVQATTKELYHSDLEGVGCGLIASAICTDLAFSSALGNDEFVKGLNASFPRRSVTTRVADRIAPLLPSVAGTDQNQGGVSLLASDRTTLLGTTFYDDPGGEEGTIDASKPVKIFDPSEPGPVINGSQKIRTNTPYNKFLKPVINASSQNQTDSGDKTLRGFLAQVPGTFNSAAAAMDYMYATDDPALNPRALLKRVLTNIRNRIPDLNITGDLSADESLTLGPAIDFCLLTQGFMDAKNKTSMEFTHAGGGAGSGRTYRVHKTNDLLTMLLTSLSRTYSGKGKYSGVLPVANEQETANFGSINMMLAKYIHLNLFNAFDLTKHNEAVISGETRIIDFTENIKAYPSPTLGVTKPDFEGKSFSPSRNSDGLRYTDWKAIQHQLKYYEDNVNTPGDKYAMPLGQLVVPYGHYGEGTRGGQYGEGNAPPPATPFGLLVFDDANSVSPIRRFKGFDVKSRLQRITGEAYNRSIFKDIVTDMDALFEAAISRGPIVDRSTGRMISSGVDPAYLASLLISMYGHIVSDLLGIHLIPQAVHSGDSKNAGRSTAIRNTWTGAEGSLTEAGDCLAVMGIRNIVKTREFINELIDFVDNNVSPDPGKPFGLFLRQFDKIVGHNQAVTLDSIDFFRALGDQLQSSGENFLSSFLGSDQQTGNEASLERVRNILPLAIQPTQLVSMKSQLKAIEGKSGLDRYFDDFFVGRSQENFMYTLLSDTAPNRFLPSGQQLDLSPATGGNLDIVTVGIPQGFTENILQSNSVDDPSGFNERKVDVYVFVRDHIVGSGINIYPGKWTFDLGLFFNKVSDPVVTNSETRPEMTTEQGIEFYNTVTGRPFPSAEFALKNNVSLRRIKIDNPTPEIVNRPEDVEKQKIFDNHVYDQLAKVYIKITTGMEVTEESFLLDSSLEQKAGLEPDLSTLRSLLNKHLSKLLGREVTFDDYLAGNRKFRELLQRLETGKKTTQIVDEIRARVEGSTPEQDMLSSEDMVAFSRMISPRNPIITPGLMREKVVSPRVFERVFCLFIDPDKVRGVAPKNSPTIANHVKRMYSDTAGIDPAASNNPVLKYSETKLTGPLNNIPRARAYEVLVVPHGTPVVAENAPELLSDFRDY
jgi:hypothetical protein